VPLGHLGDTHPGRDAFDRKLDTVQSSSETLISLNDFSPDFGKFLFGSDHHWIANWCSHESSARFFGEMAGTETFSDVGARGAAYVASLGVSNEQGTCR
jgi:hypothetical protein